MVFLSILLKIDQFVACNIDIRVWVADLMDKNLIRNRKKKHL